MPEETAPVRSSAQNAKATASLWKNIRRLVPIDLRIFGKHCRDLCLIMFLITFIIPTFILILVLILFRFDMNDLWSLLADLHKGEGQSTKIALIYVPAYVALTAWTAQRCYEIASRRLNAVDLIFSEIASVCTTIHTYKLFEALENLKTKNHIDERLFIKRSEDYMTIFNQNIGRLGSLDRELIREITAFYTYLKGARDGTESFRYWWDEKSGDFNRRISSEQRIEHVEAVVVLLRMCLEKAKLSLIGLAESEKDLKYNASLCEIEKTLKSSSVTKAVSGGGGGQAG